MENSPLLEIRLLQEADIPEAMELKEFAGWNQTENDWRTLLRLEPNGCFAAVHGGRVVGTTTTTCYGRELAWIGMVLVRPDSRRAGIATELMKTALDYLSQKVATVKLDATPQGKEVYEKLGFQVESRVERWAGNRQSSRRDSAPTRTLIDAKARRELLALDRDAFSADRSKLLEVLIDNASAPPVFSRSDDGLLTGYALARIGSKAEYVGPVITKDSARIGALLDRMLSQLGSPRVYIDFNTENSSASVLIDKGFVKERDLIRMSRGERNEKTSSLVFGIAGPEIG